MEESKHSPMQLAALAPPGSDWGAPSWPAKYQPSYSCTTTRKDEAFVSVTGLGGPENTEAEAERRTITGVLNLGHLLEPDLGSCCMWHCLSWHFCSKNPQCHRLSKARTKLAVLPTDKLLPSQGDVTGILSLEKVQRTGSSHPQSPSLQGLMRSWLAWGGRQLAGHPDGKWGFSYLELGVGNALVNYRGWGLKSNPTNCQRKFKHPSIPVIIKKMVP